MFSWPSHLFLVVWILLFPVTEAAGTIITVNDYYRNVQWMFVESQEKMTFSTAATWTEELKAGGYADWELPTTPDGEWEGRTYSKGVNESKLNVKCSDLGHLYYTVMGYDAASIQNSTSITSRAPFSWQEYWLGTNKAGQVSTHPDADSMAWIFDFSSGVQALQSLDLTAYALAVRTEPLPASATPEPNTALLFLTGLLCLTYRPSSQKQLM